MALKKEILTPYQHRIIISKLIDGLTFDEIGIKYKLTMKGVHYHFNRVYRVLGISESSQLFFAYRRYLGSEKILVELGLDLGPLKISPGPLPPNLLDELVEFLNTKKSYRQDKF